MAADVEFRRKPIDINNWKGDIFFLLITLNCAGECVTKALAISSSNTISFVILLVVKQTESYLPNTSIAEVALFVYIMYCPAASSAGQLENT